MSRAHDLLVEEDWAGADLGQLARWTLDPYRDASNDRITVDGPRLIVDASSSTSLVLILHELATNAAKYGALSTSAGALDLKWRRDGGNLVLIWSELCGRAIEPPARQGFGTRLVQGIVSHELKGKVRFDYRAEGLHCEVSFPFSATANQSREPG